MQITSYKADRYYSNQSYSSAGKNTAGKIPSGRDYLSFLEAGGKENDGGNAGKALSSQSAKVYDPSKPIYTTEEKLKMDWEYEQELEDARINDPAKYEEMIWQRKQDIVKSFRQLEELAGKNTGVNGGLAIYKGVPINFDFKNKSISIGNMSSGRIINAGRLSNGYSFSFNRDNITDVAAVLDLFSPEDIKKIMEAITVDNMAQRMEYEIDETKAGVGKTAEQANGDEKLRENESQADETQIDQPVLPNLSDLKSMGGAGGEEDKTATTSEIVVGPDGSKTLVITVKMGEQEIVTKVQLSPAKPDKDAFGPVIRTGDEQYAAWNDNLTKAEEAASAYASSFLYESSGKSI